MWTGPYPDAPSQRSPTRGGVCLLTLGFRLELPASGDLPVFGRQTRPWQWEPFLSTAAQKMSVEAGGKRQGQLLHKPSLDVLLVC